MREKSHRRVFAAAAVRAWPLLAALCAGQAQAGGPADLYYERTLVGAANARCKLFTPGLAAALAAAAAQARGAALRSGASSADLAQVRARAEQKGAGLDCRSKDLGLIAARVKLGFQAYARLTRMTYAGDVASWRAERVQPSKGVSWRLEQETRFGADRMIFGLAGPRGAPGAVAAVVTFADGASPYAARLLIRDPARASEAYLHALRIGPSSRLPLAARTAPRNAVSAFLAEARGPADASLVGDDRPAILFRFPARTAALMAELDPREAVTVEFVFAGRSGDQIRRAYVEVGDFAAARAFLAVP